MNQDNPFCKICEETVCSIDKNNECQIVRKCKIYKKFQDSVYNSIKAEWEKTREKILNENN